MLYILNLTAIIYIILLCKKKNPVSLSMYWVIVFYAIYIFIPIFRNQITEFNGISDDLVERLASYSMLGLISFISTNWFFMLKWGKLKKVSLIRQIEVSYNNVSWLFKLFIVLSIILVTLTIGASGIINIFNSGSGRIWLYETNNNIFSTFAELSLFYVAIIGSVLVLSSNNNKDKKKSYIIFITIIMFISMLTFARRYVVYPLFAIIFYKLSKNTNKVKIATISILLIPIFFMVMFMTGYFRTFGINDFNLNSIISYFQYGNFMDIFMSNTDFVASYKYFSYQIEYGDIFVGPTGYFKAVFAFIPRILWPDKPGYTSVEILSILEPQKVSQGFSAASGYIGEAHAALGLGGVVIVSCLWGILCGYLDNKYHYIITNKKIIYNDVEVNRGFTVFEYYYLYTAMLLITESHRGDFGAASLHFILEIVFIGILLKLVSKKHHLEHIQKFTN